ncbi:MAG: AraC family transcriptional regulator [Cupriavidus sp.]|nr:AraC family transcriptional regulator [Cupriavidus sp.]
MFASQGLDVPRLLAEVGIEKALLDAPDARFDTDQVTRLWELAVAWSGNPTLGLDRRLAAAYVNFDVVGYAMLSSPDLRTGLDKFSQYLALISDTATFELQPQGGDCWLVLGHIGNSLRVPRQRQEYGLLSLLVTCEWITRRQVKPLRAESVFPQPTDAARHQLAFDCPIHFDCAYTRLLLARNDLTAPVPSHNPSLLAMHERLLQERSAELGTLSIRHRVRREILRRLHLGEPRRVEIATELAITDRTLQRRLHAERTSFAQLLDETRRELARKHLADQHYPLAEISYMLGFVDESNFFRACKRWFGMPPSQYRELQLARA